MKPTLTPLETLKKSLENILWVYTNTFVALHQWVQECKEDPETVVDFKGEQLKLLVAVPTLRAAEVVAGEEWLHGSALMQLVTQAGRVVDRYLEDRVKPNMTVQPLDDTWFSVESIEWVSGVTFKELYAYASLVRLQLIRPVIEKGEAVTLSQQQIIEMIHGLARFAEEFDARYELELAINKKSKKKGKKNVKDSSKHDRISDVRPDDDVGRGRTGRSGPNPGSSSHGTAERHENGSDDVPDPTEEDRPPEGRSEDDDWDGGDIL